MSLRSLRMHRYSSPRSFDMVARHWQPNASGNTKFATARTAILELRILDHCGKKLPALTGGTGANLRRFARVACVGGLWRLRSTVGGVPVRFVVLRISTQHILWQIKCNYHCTPPIKWSQPTWTPTCAASPMQRTIIRLILSQLPLFWAAAVGCCNFALLIPQSSNYLLSSERTFTNPLKKSNLLIK